MKRTLATIVFAGLASSGALASFNGMSGGTGTLTAGASSEGFLLTAPGNVNVNVQDAAVSCAATLLGGATIDATGVEYALSFVGQGVTGATSAQFSTQFSLAATTEFLLSGSLAGLGGYDVRLRPTDLSFQIREYLDYDDLGFFGTLVDDFDQPVPSFNVQGFLAAGTYELLWTVRAESIDGQAYDGTGAFSLFLWTIPAPSSLLAIGVPGLLALRRRR